MSARTKSPNPDLKQELISGLEEMLLPRFVIDRAKEDAKGWSDKRINFCRKWDRRDWLLWYYWEW